MPVESNGKVDESASSIEETLTKSANSGSNENQADKRLSEQRRRQRDVLSINAVGVSDAPLSLSDPDALGTKDTALALSKFLQNRDTKPPLTIAVSGNWGSGKSSLMNLTKEDLESAGYPVVWFNAWHHQKEEHLFAALLQAIREEAVPRVLSWEGIKFRAKLFWTRLFSDGVGTIAWVALILVLALIGAWLFQNPPPYLEKSKGSAFIPPVLTSFFALYSRFTAGLSKVGTSPGKLMATIGRMTSVRAMDAQLSLRSKFAEAFREACDVFAPRHLLIVVDDLDRCRPDQVGEVLETINFLVDSGKCVILAGVSREQVEDAVGVCFKDIAEEKAPADSASGEITEAQKKMARAAYARDYLEKLFNIEIEISPLDREAAMHLARQWTEVDRTMPSQTVERLGRLRRLIRKWLNPLVAVLLAALAAAALWLSASLFVMEQRLFLAHQLAEPIGVTVFPDDYWYNLGHHEQELLDLSDQINSVNTALSLSPQNPRLRQELIEVRGKLDQRRTYLATITRWDVVLRWLIATSFLLLTLVIIVVALYLGRTRYQTRFMSVVSDSQGFKNACAKWVPVIAGKHPSPRAAKRFINRIRFLAMLRDETKNRKGLPDDMLAALAAVDHLCPGNLLKAISEEDPGNFGGRLLGRPGFDTPMPSETGDWAHLAIATFRDVVEQRGASQPAAVSFINNYVRLKRGYDLAA